MTSYFNYKILYKARKKFMSLFFPHVLRQEVLLKKALKEHGINPNKLRIVIDHDKGKNWINDLEFGIKYPDSHLTKIESTLNIDKSITFYFNGFMGDDEGRRSLLKPFEAVPKALIISSSHGRKRRLKGEVNLEYYAGLGKSKFGLCPHQLDWPGSWSHMWTYRFIDCVIAGSVPVLFRKTPLAESFVSGFNFYWDDEILDKYRNVGNNEILSQAGSNLERAKERFFFTPAELQSIRESNSCE